MGLDISPIGQVVGGRDEAFDDHWGPVTAAIELDPERFTPEALAGLAGGGHEFARGVRDRPAGSASELANT